jgi:transposase
MFPDANLPVSLMSVLLPLAPCFTAPAFRTFCGLVAGLTGQVRRRTVVGMLLGACLAWPHDRAHYFFSRACWEIDEVGVAVAFVVVALFLDPGADITVAVDDSVSVRCGKHVHGAGWQHDGSAKNKQKLSFGNCFVTAGIVVALPFCSRTWCLPVLARLHLPGKDAGPSKTTVARDLVKILAGAFPGRVVHVVADAAYHGPALRDLPGNVTWTCRLPKTAVLYALAPPRTGRRGRPRTKGERLGTPADLAKTAQWTTCEVLSYQGRTDIKHTAQIRCLWYGSFRTREVSVVLSRDERITSGYSLALVTTDLPAAQDPAAIVARYVMRWAIEVSYNDSRLVLGAGEARNRSGKAVERTVPFALLVHTLIVCWYARHGYAPADIDARRAEQPWYTEKAEPAFEDMVVKLRRTLIAARFSVPNPAHATDSEIRAVLGAWAAAAA